MKIISPNITRLLRLLMVGCFIIFLIPLAGCNGSSLKKDENIWFFPTSANLTEKGLEKKTAQYQWSIPVHHWVFEKEQGSITRELSQKVLSEIIEGLGVSEEQADSLTFRQRIMWFLVDNERNKKVEVSIQDQIRTLNLTGANGHAVTLINISSKAEPGEWLSFKVNTSGKHKRDFVGRVQLIPETGISVISDIDDTIKISEVLDKKVLIKNTFVEPYRVTKGFPDYYKKLQNSGAYFHYVSASPWQIYPSLKPFLDEYYPQGSISLRNFRLKDSSLLDFMKPSLDYKIKQIKRIIQRYPKHQFILIGDSGEYDPEVYANIYKQFPKNIQSIQIRAVEGSDLSEKRFSETFTQVPKSRWQLFKTPTQAMQPIVAR